MRRTSVIIFLAALIGAHSSHAAGRKDCDELRQEIATKLQTNGVSAYTLTIVSPETTTDGKIVGSCNGGTQRIAYRRVTAASTSDAALAAHDRGAR